MKRFTAFLLFLPVLCFAQTGAHRIGQILVKGNNIAANVAPFANIQVCVAGTGCKTLANIYGDAALTSPLSNPLAADGSGNYDYYIASGCVDEQVSAPGQSTISLTNVCPFNGTSGGGGGGGLNPGTQQQVVFYPTSGTTGGPTYVTIDSATKSSLTVPNAISTSSITSNTDNNVSQASTVTVSGMNSLLTSIGSTGSVVIPTTVPTLIAAPTYNNPSTVATTGGFLAPGTYSYLVCSVNSLGVEQKCSSSVIGSSSSNHTSITITSGTTNTINFSFAVAPGISHYNLYGRIAGSWGFIKTLIVGGGALFDDGSITPGAAPQQNFTNTYNVGIDDLRYGVIQHYATGVPVREYGCAEDGVTDDTACVQAAINYAESSGIDVVDFTPGKTYKLAAISGTVALAGDDGTCPSGATVNGAACTAISPQYTMQAYSISLGEGNIKIRLNGAKLIGGYTATQGASPSAPAMFACSGGSGCSQLEIDGGANGTNGTNGSINNVFIGIVAPGTYAFNSIHDVNFGDCGFPLLVQSWDSSEAHNNTVTCEAGFTVGGWYYSRANNGSAGLNAELGGYADGYQISNSRYNGLGAFLANHANTDNYFYTYIYQGQNQGNGRMVDVPGTSSPNGAASWNNQIPYYGVFGQANILYGRYGRQNNGPSIINFQIKNAARSAVVSSAYMNGGNFQTIGTEFAALCDNTAYFVGDPVNCPDPWYSNINAGFIHGTFINGFALSIANPAGYQQVFSNASNSTYLNTGRTPTQPTIQAPNKLGINGASNGSTTQSSASGAIIYSDTLLVTPTNPESGIGSVWTENVIQNVGAPTGHVGDYLSISHNALAPVSDFFVQVPALMLGNTPQGLCDGPASLYSGHAGILNYVSGASGVADTLSVCLKNASNAYSWQSIAVSPTTGFTGSCASTTTLTVVNGIITGCS